MTESLPTARCEACASDVLTFRDLDPDGNFTYHCLDCGAQLNPSLSAWSHHEAAQAGYVIEGYRDPSQELSSGCSGGSCSGGSCSSH